MAATLLYIYRNDDLHQVYIGIGESAQRVWGGHNPRATNLLNHPATKVFVTTEMFPDRASAERAESAAICAAAAAGVTVLSDRDDLGALTNIAKVGSSRHLSRAVFQRDGVVRYSDLNRTAIVTLHLDSIGDMADGSSRPTIHGGRSDEDIRQRATRWWGLGRASRRRERAGESGTLPRDVDVLIAVQKGVGTILGAWDLTDRQWHRDPERNGWVFDTEEETTPATSQLKGQQFDWAGAHPSNTVTWSSDIRELNRSLR